MRTSPFSAVLTLCLRAAGLDWSEIDPSIFGTLFVRASVPANALRPGPNLRDFPFSRWDEAAVEPVDALKANQAASLTRTLSQQAAHWALLVASRRRSLSIAQAA
jgi:hypothetical protein